MLTYLRTHMKTIMLVVVVIFAASMFYGLGSGIRGGFGGKKRVAGFLKVNGQKVSPIRFRQILMQVRQSFPDQIKPQEALFLQNMALSQTIDFMVMLQDAKQHEKISGRELNRALEEMSKQQGFSTVKEFKKALKSSGSEFSWNDIKKMVKEDMLVQKRVGKIRSQQKVSSRDLREVRARHILIRIENEKEEEAKKLAQELKERIKKGEDFAKLAKEYSSDPGSAKKGGDLGFFSTGAMVKPFEDLAFSLKMGEVGGPVKTIFGYHIIKVEDARLRRIEGEKDVEKAILKQKQEKAFRDWFYEIKQNAKVEILDPALKALDLRFKGRMGEAVLEYQKAISADPGNVFLHLSLGLLYEDSGQIDKAIYEYGEAVKLSPGEPSLYIILGDAYRKSKKMNEALKQYKQASLIAGDNKAVHQQLLDIYGDLKRFDLEAKERNEIFRIEKKEVFEKEIRESSKLKTE